MLISAQVRCLYPVVVVARITALLHFLVLRCLLHYKLRILRESCYGGIKWMGILLCQRNGCHIGVVWSNISCRGKVWMHWKSAAKLILQTSCFLELHLGRSPCCPSSATVNSEYLLRQINFRRELFTVELGGRTLGWFVLANHYDLTRPSQGWGFLKHKIVFFKLISDVQPHFSKWKSHFQGSVVVGKQQIPGGNYLPHDALLRNLVSVLPVGGPPSAHQPTTDGGNSFKCQKVPRKRTLPVWSGHLHLRISVLSCKIALAKYWSNNSCFLFLSRTNISLLIDDQLSTSLLFSLARRCSNQEIPPYVPLHPFHLLQTLPLLLLLGAFASPIWFFKLERLFFPFQRLLQFQLFPFQQF